ncbi:YceI family protein [Saccharopolyspora griseoalba]|uniref:YceI family protein n=1 Tax=Saccharopolyspora griseoalba TaxID=1431848 RepID=A0ABW2LH40_9PSEU
MVFAKLRRRLSGADAGVAPRGVFALHPTPLDSGVVTGQVHDENGNLLPDATVNITNRMGQVIAEASTDSYGGFAISVAPGTHKLSIAAGGFRRYSTKLQVQVNQRTPLGGIQLVADDSLELPQPGRYRFDPLHTEIRFVAQHIGMSKIHGRFNEFDGFVEVAPSFEHSRIEMSINTASVDTGVQMRDDHLRSADFFDVENHPVMHFRGTRFTHLRADRWSVSGSLTLRGNSSPVSLNAIYLGQRRFQGPGFDSDLRVACQATTTLRREDYAVNWQATLAKGIAVVGPTIEVELGVQAVFDQ